MAAGPRIPVVPAFDGYRALAVLGVVLFHVFEVCGVYAAMRRLRAGVLILGAPAAEHSTHSSSSAASSCSCPPSLATAISAASGSFAIRRAARLLPAYWLALAVALVLIAALGSTQ